MSKSKIKEESIGRSLTKFYREDLNEVIPKFKQFAHFSQFVNVSRKTEKIPVNPNGTMMHEVRIDSSPTIYTGELLFGIDDTGKLTWLAEIIDSGD